VVGCGVEEEEGGCAFLEDEEMVEGSLTFLYWERESFFLGAVLRFWAILCCFF
jgi:hypothetical protein